MDKPVFIKCEECGETYKELYVLRRKQVFVRQGICTLCIYRGHEKGSLTESEAQKLLDEWHGGK